MIIAICIILLLFVLYLILLCGRSDHPKLAELRGWGFAHRGLHGDGIPENSIAAFRAALDNGYGIELDVHLLKDGNLAVIHDASLLRTAGCDVKIEDLTTEQLRDYRLEGTDETIPTFHEVLELSDGKAPLIIELKAERGNHAQLTEAICKMLESYSGAYCLESFDPRCTIWLKKHRPELIRGQLTENFFASKNKLPAVLKLLLTCQLGNIVFLPDFVAYKYADRKNPGMFLVRKFWKVQGVSWTIRSQEEYDTACKEGWIPIFEGFRPQAKKWP